MIADCFRYYKGCEECQKHGDVQLVPTALMHLIIKPWPFRAWGLDFIGKIHPLSSKGHCFVIVATDYFTKWTKAIPLKNMTHREVIEFITRHIIHRFGIPQTLTTDQGTSFYPKGCVNLLIPMVLSCSIHLHIMLKPMVKPGLATKR
jgi:hypothetical protein